VLRAGSFGLSAGQLATSQLQFGSAAVGAQGVFLPDDATPTLSWDPDGAGAKAAEALVSFLEPVSLAADDFVLI